MKLRVLILLSFLFLSPFSTKCFGAIAPAFCLKALSWLKGGQADLIEVELGPVAHKARFLLDSGMVKNDKDAWTIAEYMHGERKDLRIKLTFNGEDARHALEDLLASLKLYGANDNISSDYPFISLAPQEKTYRKSDGRVFVFEDFRDVAKRAHAQKVANGPLSEREARAIENLHETVSEIPEARMHIQRQSPYWVLANLSAVILPGTEGQTKRQVVSLLARTDGLDQFLQTQTSFAKATPYRFQFSHVSIEVMRE